MSIESLRIVASDGKVHYIDGFGSTKFFITICGFWVIFDDVDQYTIWKDSL